MLTFYLIIVNIIAFACYGYDKHCAKTRRWRVPERTLLAAAVVGGSIGAYLGMMSFRHKTRHRKFLIAVPLMATVHILILIMLI